MSKVHPGLTFPDKGLYSPSLFRLKTVEVSPSNPPSGAYYGPNQVIEFNVGGGSNEFIIGETCHLTFEAKVFGADALVADGAATRFAGHSPTGLPRFDFGCNWFSEVDTKLDRTRSIDHFSGAQLCRDFINGQLACGPYPSFPDPLSLTGSNAGAQGGTGTFDQSTHNSSGPLALCNFQSNFRRQLAFAGVYRKGAGPLGDAYDSHNGGTVVRLPASALSRIWGPQNSSLLPIGLFAQSSESGINMRLRTAAYSDCVVDPSPNFSTLRESTTGDGAGVDAPGSYGIYSPKLSYRSIEILDQGLLASLQAVYNGAVAETLMLDGAMQSVPRLLTIAHDSFRNYQFVHPSGRRKSYMDISTTEPSVKALMIRLTQSATKAPNVSKVFENPDITVESLQIRVGSKVYPLTPVTEQLVGSGRPYIVDANTMTLPELTGFNIGIRDQGMTATAQAAISASNHDAQQLISPFGDWSHGGALDQGASVALQDGIRLGDFNDNRQWIRPVLYSFENKSMLEDLRGQDKLAASGIDLRGVGSLRVELSLIEIDSTRPASAAVAPTPVTAAVDVTVSLLSDHVLRVARNVLDDEYAFTLFA